ncbi:Pimeloyl-ACP methyl ester carboxylesterase [Arthrobacter alpinus]|uniref:Pimeloyl-ACP methyl ester carboxylesterase n=1 Tax=Arthrobacter alpinus TaxID=656366 RepID=A0A1H5DYL4_9MICC|nr:alpha/beta hydrolase [Arthrobacter alpinus]SED83961.1 Pimeloyl-ACP methyl ester carboxylesterase [Arthrobacter alpinus]
MRKFLRILLKVIAVFVAVVAVALATTTIVNASASKSEAGRIESYGQRVTVDGKQMNVLIQGDAAETVVLLPGFGTAAPALDFAPLIAELAPHYRVVVVEPFGYGLSDETEKPRTAQNINTEVHSALASLGIDRYALMGHSIAGIYALDYANRFRGELTAFVGIDSSVPTQPGMDDALPIAAMKTAKTLGLTRVLMSMAGDPYAGLPYDDDMKEQMKLLSLKNSMSSTYSDEMEHFASNFTSSRSQSFPRDLPVLEFVQRENTDVEGWLPLHEEQVASVDTGELIQLDATHYLHHTKSPEIAENFTRFMASVNQNRT